MSVVTSVRSAGQCYGKNAWQDPVKMNSVAIVTNSSIIEYSGLF